MNKIYCTIIDWEMNYRLCLLWYKAQEISDFECSLNVKAVTHSQVFAVYMELLTQ